MKNIIFIVIVFFSCTSMFAQHFLGIGYSKSFVNNRSDAGEDISYTTRGTGLNIQYQYKYKRFGIEANLYGSSLNYEPYIYNESRISGYYSSIDKAETKSINSFGLATNLICYVLPHVLYIKLGMVFMSSQYFEGSYVVGVHSNNSHDVTYTNKIVSSNQEGGRGLSLGTGLLIPIYKQWYAMSNLDYYFVNMNTDVNILRTSSSGSFINNSTPEIKYAYINLSLGLSYKFAQKSSIKKGHLRR
jgi:hypothetical protein